MKNIFNIRENIGEIGSFALPIFIEQLCIASMSIISAMMVSHISSAAIAGVSLVEAINVLIQQIFLSLEVGATVVVAQYCGRKDHKSAGEAIVQAMLTSICLASVISALMLIFPNFMLGMVFGDAEAAVYEAGRIYFMFAVISFPFLSIYSIAVGSIRGSGNPRQSLIGVLVTNCSFVVLGFFFIKILNMGVYGAGMALLIARILGAATGLILLKKGNSAPEIARWIPKKIRWDIQKSILTIGIPSCIEAMIFSAGRLVTQTFVVPYGTQAIAVNAIANSIAAFYNIPGSTASTMSIPVVGKYIGMKDKKRAIDMSRIILCLAMLVMAILSILFILFIHPITGLFTSDPVIITAMIPIITLNFIIAPFTWPPSFVTPAVLRSSGAVKYTTTVAIFSMVLFRMTIGYILAVNLGLGVIGVWIGMWADWIVRTVLFGMRYLKGKWAERQLIKDD